MIRSLIAAFAVTAVFALPAVAQTAQAPKLPPNVDPQNAIIMQTTKGPVVFVLRPDIAPKHAERIKQLAREGFYDNVPFHRVIDRFMAQTGDGQYGNGTGGSRYPDLPAEFSNVPFTRGTVGMARAQSPNSANSQFFITFGDASFLNGQYTVIGQVVSGMENVDKLKRGEPVQNPDKIVSMKVAADVK
ncbi:peptidylprolyl isomerase [Ancylobacter sonchi]|uniref:peptidylprolyl isomerase n=1 Tax=Ancylobacter TaxID=99 RepID=UPI001BD551A0|nr:MULTISPECIES: peptidylprolyl isomerase [Ancylobacter]MBS7535760.1 peptidylprolyl isomerase [Ancylobacter sonchi]MCB4771515.1 peptidylprolyl isomerase [Ancylobacter sp. Lp-2]